MIPTNNDFEKIRQSIETASGLDPEPIRRCGEMMRIGAFDEAVLKAFILLEERLRSAVGKDGMTGANLANNAFAPDSPLAKHLGRTLSEREGLREIYSGAFKLFRNPAAHGVVGYTAADGKSIVALVNLLLSILARAGEVLPPDVFPPSLDVALADAEKLLGSGIASRLRAFLGKCLKAGIKPQSDTKQWVPFRRYAMLSHSHWPAPKPRALTVFYVVRAKEVGLFFPINQYWVNVKGLELQPIVQSLRTLGFMPSGKTQDYYLALTSGHDQVFFDKLSEFVANVNDQLEATLKTK